MTTESPLSEKLEAIGADLATGFYQDVLVRIFRSAPGLFHPLRPLADGDDNLCHALDALKADQNVTLQFLWAPTPSPPGSEGEGWALLAVYSPEWNGLAQSALVDRAYVLKRGVQ